MSRNLQLCSCIRKMLSNSSALQTLSLLVKVIASYNAQALNRLIECGKENEVRRINWLLHYCEWQRVWWRWNCTHYMTFVEPLLSASAGQPVSFSQLAHSPLLGVDPYITAEKKKATVLSYMTNTCGCQRHNNGPCFQQYTIDYVLHAIMDAAELSKCELDIVILGLIMAFTNTQDTVSATLHYTVLSHD